MQKTEFKKLFKNKSYLKRLYSAFTVVAVVAILILVNVLADKLPWTYDMTADKIFTLSEQTSSVLENLEN